MLGLERFTGAPCCLHSARSASDVVIYAFPAGDFEELALKYPYVRQFVEAHDTVSADYQWANDARDPQKLFLPGVVGRRALEHSGAHASIREWRSRCWPPVPTPSPSDGDRRVQAMVTVDSVLAWVAGGAWLMPGSRSPDCRGSAPPAVGSAASVTDCVLAMSEPAPTRWR
jgi:hypothetical protein